MGEGKRITTKYSKETKGYHGGKEREGKENHPAHFICWAGKGTKDTKDNSWLEIWSEALDNRSDR